MSESTAPLSLKKVFRNIVLDTGSTPVISTINNKIDIYKKRLYSLLFFYLVEIIVRTAYEIINRTVRININDSIFSNLLFIIFTIFSQKFFVSFFFFLYFLLKFNSQIIFKFSLTFFTVSFMYSSITGLFCSIGERSCSVELKSFLFTLYFPSSSFL